MATHTYMHTRSHVIVCTVANALQAASTTKTDTWSETKNRSWTFDKHTYTRIECEERKTGTVALLCWHNLNRLSEMSTRLLPSHYWCCCYWRFCFPSYDIFQIMCPNSGANMCHTYSPSLSHSLSLSWSINIEAYSKLIHRLSLVRFEYVDAVCMVNVVLGADVTSHCRVAKKIEPYRNLHIHRERKEGKHVTSY